MALDDRTRIDPAADLAALEARLRDGVAVMEAAAADRRFADALVASEDVSGTIRRLREAEPENALHVFAAAGLLHNRSHFLQHVGRVDQAVTAAAESASLFRSLVPADPGFYRPYLADALVRLGSALRAESAAQSTAPESARQADARDSGNPALPGAAGAVDAVNPGASGNAPNTAGNTTWTGNPATQPAPSPNETGTGDSAIGPARALVPVAEAVRQYRELIFDHPQHRTGLARTLVLLGELLTESGDSESAIDAMREAADLYRSAAEGGEVHYSPAGGDPLPVGWQLLIDGPPFAQALRALAVANHRAGRSGAAVSDSRAAVEVQRQVVAARPAAEGTLADLLVEHAEILDEAGYRIDARNAIEEAIARYGPEVGEPRLSWAYGVRERIAGQ